MIMISSPAPVQSQSGESMRFKRAVDDISQTRQIQRRRNPNHMNHVVWMQIVPLKHGSLKNVQSAIHTPYSAATAKRPDDWQCALWCFINAELRQTKVE